MKAHYKTWGDKYSGFLVGGTAQVRAPKDPRHIERAFYLTSQLESPKYGAVNSYDGCGMSAGPLHNIAVYKSNLRQGSLWNLLSFLEPTGTKSVENLWIQLKQVGWYVSPQGKLRSWNSGRLIEGSAIRDELSGPGGKVPKDQLERTHQRARAWALLFHGVFGDEATFAMQRQYATRYLIQGQKTLESEVYLELPIEGVMVGPANDQLHPMLDLAMCVYHCHSVNAPAIARRCLKTAMRKQGAHFAHPKDFASELITALGTYDYGRWRDRERGYNRYDAARRAAKNSLMWPEQYFDDDGIMPENLDW